MVKGKVWDQKFGLMGFPLYLGPGSQADVRLGSYRLQFLVIWGVYDPQVLMKFHANVKKTENSWSLVCSK